MQLNEFQKIITENNLDAYIVTHNNMFIGQDILPEENKIQELCGFSGSAGTLLVFQKKAILFVDGRYTLQAAQQVDTSQIEVITTHESLATWLQNNIFENLKIGYNAWCHTIGEVDYWNRVLKRFEFCEDKKNLLDIRPSNKECNIFEHDIAFAGISMDEKISQLSEYIQKNKCDAYLITACDCVSWLLNLRSDCLPDTPIFRAYALINALGEVSLFTNNFASLTKELEKYSGKTIGLAYNNAPKAVFSIMKEQGIWVENLNNPILLWKAVKNPVERDNLRQAHIRDALSVCSFMYWLEQNWKNKTECDIVQKLHDLRSQNKNYFSESFPTIAGFGSNGAIVHYVPTAETNAALKEGSLLLVDSGAQYLNGTTDITRTFCIGTPSSEMINDYTLVLKAHIALASCLYPQGTSGQSLDIIARSQLWKQGKDYAHGTGHGVGFFLNVHEGPQSISSRSSQTPLQEGMIVSIEPGFYKENAYGIRIENLVEIVSKHFDETDTNMLRFEPLTLVPFESELMNKEMLTQEERKFINGYHQKILCVLRPHIKDSNLLSWLGNKCREI